MTNVTGSALPPREAGSRSEHLKKLEYHIKETLIPPIVGKEFISDDTRRIFSLPARLGGLGFLDPCSMADLEYESSVAATSQLTNNNNN